MHCPDCGEPDRRRFLKTTALGGVAMAASAAAKFTGTPETLVGTLHKSLTPEQRKVVAMPFDHPLRSKVDNNWHITKAKVGEFFTADQQAMILEIFRGLHNPDFVDKVLSHMQEDAKGFGNYSVALFGEPGTGKFEFVLTGRHCTARCDGDSVDGVAFGGPIFYGHQAGPNFTENPDHPNNVYWYQAKRANEVFQALSGKQRETALLSGEPRKEEATDTVRFRKKSELVGLPVSDMTRDQRGLVKKVLADLLLPFRKQDVAEAMKYIDEAGGVSSLAMSFFKNLDLGNDGVWDVWQLESPNMVWYFRGHPHVHTWVNIRKG
ncbi:MAG: DUF3500 domain-containing protein [Acidobacteria bacterium]|nr:DUF3500 domain-containing protein [Acidobacteriota bacterium]MBI3471253.1 DUF3500 domain-containing protein [Candidatus Solibacter usitatus]